MTKPLILLAYRYYRGHRGFGRLASARGAVWLVSL